jgi:hypothetical protein
MVYDAPNPSGSQPKGPFRRFEYSDLKCESGPYSRLDSRDCHDRFEIGTRTACRRVRKISVSSERYLRRYTTVVSVSAGSGVGSP